jgi:peroxiredoxin
VVIATPNNHAGGDIAAPIAGFHAADSMLRVPVGLRARRCDPVRRSPGAGHTHDWQEGADACFSTAMRISLSLLATVVLAVLASGSPSRADAGPSSPVIGKPAPDFALKDLDGKQVALSSFKGKVVVLEWFNPGCPFVRASHSVGSLVDTAKRHTKDGVVWLAINSGASGKQGNDLATNVQAVKSFSMTNPVLRDESGAIGKAYGATNTPNMFVIDKTGTVVYAGAIDNSPDGEGKSPQGGKLVNYVDAALEDVAAGRPVKTAVTKPYGCSVKYGS